MANQIRYIKLGEHRGRRRIWLEGRHIESAGFVPGITYRVSTDRGERSLTLELGCGSHMVSRKSTGGSTVPVIDICNSELTELFGNDVSRIKVEISASAIRITVHPDDAAMLERAERLQKKLSDGAPLAMGSVAHGGGILDHALHEGLRLAGFKATLSWAVEIEHDYIEHSMRVNPVWSADTTAIEGPMQEVETGILAKVDILVGGLPCTGASVAGRAKNKLAFAEQHETAGALFLAFLNIVKAANPSCVVLENVIPFANTISMHIIRSVLDAWGYVVHEEVLDGQMLGALEDRKRLCMVAVTRGVEFNFKALVPCRDKEDRLAEVLEDVPLDSPMWNEYPYLAEKEERDIAAGKGFRRQILTSNAPGCGTIGRGYAKCRSTEIKIQHPHNPKLMRQVTPAEHARIKTVPAFLIEGLCSTRAHEILGQGVIHCAFMAVGKLLGSALLGVTGAINSFMSDMVSETCSPRALVEEPCVATAACQGVLF